MALVTNNISGSASNSSKIGITGSVIIGNAPDARFPTAGTDTVFFVSGSDASRAVFGGTAVVSGSLITDGNVRLGDSSNDTLTINASTVSIPNNLNFDSNTLYIDSVNNRIGIGKVPNVTFDVSGTLNTVGADKPSTIFNGDTFISGAFGVSDYIQMNPVGSLRIPTNKSASYIYTSGSTNDLYFTQYAPGTNFTNTTRLRWLEGMLTTGLLHGGVLSTANGSTTFSITSGSGLIVSYNAALGSDPYPTINFVSWPAYVSSSLTYVTSSLLTYIGINPSGGIIQQTSPFTLSADSNFITIGRVLHQSGSVTNGTTTQPIVAYGTNHWQDDFTRAFGPLKVSGHILAASSSAGVGTLGLTKTAGDSYVIGKNYATDPNNPNNITSATDTAVTVSKIYRAYVSGSTLKLDTGVGNAGFTTIDPTVYNNNGTLTAVGANASIQRVYWYPNSVSRSYTVYYGSQTYVDPPGSGQNALDNAQQNIASEPFTEGENTAGAAILVGYILALGTATDLTDPAQARIIQAGISRGAGAGGGGGVAVGSTTPGGLDTYVQFNDGGSTFGGDAGLTYNKTTDTLTISGDLAINGGDLTSTSTTFNLVDSTATTVNFGGGASTALNIGNSAGTNTILGTSKFSQGLSGSHTRLADGTSYLIASSPVTITTGSNGAVTIGSTASSMVGGNGSNDNVITADGAGGLVAESNLGFNGNVLNVTGSIIASNLNSSDKVLITSGSSRTISQAANLTWDSTNSYLGIAVATPGRNLNVDTGARFGSTDYVELVAGNATSWRWSTGGSITTIEHNPKFIVPTNVGNFIGFQSQNGSDPDVGFSRPAAGILNISGSAPGAIFRFNATSTPLAAGDLGMNTTTGRPQAFIGGTAVALAHTGEIAPVGSAYVTIGSDATLTGERALTSGTGISVTDGGANSTATIAINNSVVATISGSTFTGITKHNAGLSGSLTNLTDGTSYLIAGSGILISTGSSGAVTLSRSGSIDGDITAVVAGTGLTGGGLSGSVSLAINNSIVATVSGTTFTGVTKHNSGLSGSLTKLVDGTSYLIAGSGTTISTGSTGAITISSSGTPGGSTTQIQYNNAGVFAGSSTLTFNNTSNILASLNVSATSVTASNIIAAASSVNLFNTTATTVNFAGAATSALNIGNSLGTNTISGTIKAPQGLSGSLTKLTDGTSYLIAGTNVTISTGSNGAVTISSTGGGGATTDDFFDSTTAGSVFTTGSFAFRGQESVSSPSTKGSDTFFYVSGSTNVTGSTAKVSLFGGDVISSGSLSVGNGGTIVGNLTAINNLGVLGSLTVMSNGLIAGNATVSGSTTTNTLFVNTGNVVGAPGSGANVLSLLSSGNIVMKLDVNNDSSGHKFEVQDYLGISQFFVGENGNAELSGSLVTTGSLTVSGSATLGIVSEVLSGSNAIGGTFVFDTTRQSIFYVNNATSNITANFTNVPTVDNRIISTTVILSQSATARIVSAVQIAGVASTINWANNVTPTGNSGKQDVFGFNLIRSGSAWKTLGQMSTYG